MNLNFFNLKNFTSFVFFSSLSIFLPHSSYAESKIDISYSNRNNIKQIDYGVTVDQKGVVNSKNWNKKDKLNSNMPLKRASNFAYVGFGFDVAGVSFSTLSGGNIGTGFIGKNVLLGASARFGYEYIGRIAYVAVEIGASVMFSTSSTGLIGSGMPEDPYVNMTGIKRGTATFALNIKPGFSFNSKKGAVYLIAGVAYNLFEGVYSEPVVNAVPVLTPFTASGFGLNYGVGIKHVINTFVIAFFEFNALAPIPSGGNKNLDRIPVNENGDRVGLENLRALETYSIRFGLDFRM